METITVSFLLGIALILNVPMTFYYVHMYKQQVMLNTMLQVMLIKALGSVEHSNKENRSILEMIKSINKQL